MKTVFSLIIGKILFSIFALNLFAQPYENFSAAVHIQSDLSDGRYSIEELAKLAQEKSVKVLILSDTLLRRWEYGLWPWRNLLKKTFEEKSVLRFGVENYLSAIEQAQKKNPEVLIIPGVEVGPFYYWRGNLFNSDGLSVYNWHKKMLVLGLKEVEDYQKLPVVANYTYLPQQRSDLLKFWPVLLILLGIVAEKIRIKKFLSFKDKSFSGYVAPFASLKYIFIGAGVVSLVNNLVFSVSPFDSYHGDKGVKPFQYLIDYANKKDGMIFWLHPEANYTRVVMGVKILTYPYKDDLLRTEDYQGFSGLYFDNITATQPADVWDQILTEYCQNKRRAPVWIWGEVGFDGLTRKEINGIETILLLPRLTEEEVFRALKGGKMYAQLNRRENDFSLARFIVTDQAINKVGFMGDDVKIQGKPQIEIRLNHTQPANEEITIKLIREGKVIQELKTADPEFSWSFIDEDCPTGKKTFYRLEIESNSYKALSNPIFVTSQ